MLLQVPLRLALTLLAALAAACGPEPLPDPPEALVDFRVRAYFGSPLSGPVPLAGEVEEPRRSPLARVRVWALAALPSGSLDPLSAHAAVVVREPLPVPEILLGPLGAARAGRPADAEALVAAVAGPGSSDARYLGEHTLALPPGVTVVLDAAALRPTPSAPHRQAAVLLHRPAAGESRIEVALAARDEPAVGAAGSTAAAEPGSPANATEGYAEAGSASPAPAAPPPAETALLDPLPFVAPRAGRLGALPDPRSPTLALAVRAPACDGAAHPQGHRVADALLFVIDVRGAPTERDAAFVGHHEAWRAAVEDVRRQAVAVTEHGERAPPAPASPPAMAGATFDLDACLRELREPAHPTRPLVLLGRSVGAEALVALALAAPEPLAREIAQTIASAGFGAGRRATRDELRLLAQRAAVEAIAQASLEREVPPGIDAVACRYAGGLSRKPQELLEVVREAESSAALEAAVLAANRALLRDASSTVRVRAWRWLFERGEVVPGYDPLAPAEARRAALKRAGSASGGGR